LEQGNENMNPNRRFLAIIFLFILATFVRPTRGDESTGLTNLNFEGGKQNWAVWYSRNRVA